MLLAFSITIGLDTGLTGTSFSAGISFAISIGINCFAWVDSGFNSVLDSWTTLFAVGFALISDWDWVISIFLSSENFREISVGAVISVELFISVTGIIWVSTGIYWN